KQDLGTEFEQRLSHGRDADSQLRSQLVQSNILTRRVRTIENPPTDKARNVFGELRPRSEIRDAHRQIRYSASNRLLMMDFCISLVPSPMSRNGASRISRSISYSLEYPYPPWMRKLCWVTSEQNSLARYF